MTEWSPDSWRAAEARQLPAYPDPAALALVETELAELPPLILADDVRRLKARLADVAAGHAFLLQAGDCAETFDGAAIDAGRTARLILEMAGVITAATGLPVVKVGRVAGQFAKPRSAALEERDRVALPAWRGDIVNDIPFDRLARMPDPARMLRAYRHSAATLDALGALASDDLHVSHEALLLPYEQALTRRCATTGEWLATSAHMVWIGDRTAFEGSAHVEFARGIANPIGMKCGPQLKPDTLLRLLETLDPRREPGRVTLIGRFGHDRIERALPPLIRAAGGAGHPVIWSCDPMHGNTIRDANGHKTRALDAISLEVRRCFAIHRAEGSVAGGIHLEMTSENVVECVGSGGALEETASPDGYHGLRDPRLNLSEALAMARLIAELIGETTAMERPLRLDRCAARS